MGRDIRTMIITKRKDAVYTAADKSKPISELLSYIEEHLSEELDPENLAARHFISLSRLYRDFYARTGHSVKEYIRKRRISNACEKIKSSDLPLSIIAGESGLQTQQAFNKLFKSVVGMTPLEYRQSDTYFYFYPFDIGEVSIAVKVGAELIPEWTITRFYDSCLVDIEDKAIATAIDPAGGVGGRIFGRNGKQIGNRFCYEVMTEIAGAGKTGLYAACVVNYREPEINDGWNYLYNTWLLVSMFEQSGEGYFEEYILKNGKPHKLKLYLPVNKRKTQRHIRIAHIPEMSFITAKEYGNDFGGHNAERRSSERVLAFLQEHAPLVLRSARRFYVCAHGDICECGVECGGGFKSPAPSQSADSGVGLLRVPAGQYAILPDDCLGDARAGSAKLELWLQNNSIPHENEPIFAIYETPDGNFDDGHIKMKLYKRLKI